MDKYQKEKIQNALILIQEEIQLQEIRIFELESERTSGDQTELQKIREAIQENLDEQERLNYYLALDLEKQTGNQSSSSSCNNQSSDELYDSHEIYDKFFGNTLEISSYSPPTYSGAPRSRTPDRIYDTVLRGDQIQELMKRDVVFYSSDSLVEPVDSRKLKEKEVESKERKKSSEDSLVELVKSAKLKEKEVESKPRTYFSKDSLVEPVQSEKLKEVENKERKKPEYILKDQNSFYNLSKTQKSSIQSMFSKHEKALKEAVIKEQEKINFYPVTKILDLKESHQYSCHVHGQKISGRIHRNDFDARVSLSLEFLRYAWNDQNLSIYDFICIIQI